MKQIRNVPTKYSKSSKIDPSPDLQKVRRALLEEMGVGGDDITVHQLSGA